MYADLRIAKGCVLISLELILGKVGKDRKCTIRYLLAKLAIISESLWQARRANSCRIWYLYDMQVGSFITAVCK